MLAFDALPRLDNDGMTIGRGTRLVRAGREARPQHDDITDERSLVLLVAAHRRIAPSALKHLRRATACWQPGEGALAHIELAFAKLPRLGSEDDAFRLFLVETLLDEGLAPRTLARELGLDLEKYDPSQPRVPAGNGQESGRWGPGSGSSAEARLKPGAFFIEEDAAPGAAEAAGSSFLTDASPAIIRALATFASRFSTPTAVLGALFIPTPNSGGVTQGALPDAPDISFERDGPAGTLRLTQKLADGTDAVVAAQSRAGVYYDVATDKPLGRDLGPQLYLDLATVVAALAAGERDKPAATDDRPQLCPAPVEDVAHDPREHTLDYEDDVHQRVNPLAPIPRGFAVRIIDPATEYARMLSDPKIGKFVMDDIVDVTRRHLRAAQALGANLKVYFAEQSAADVVRARFARDEDLAKVVVGFLPPSKPKSRGRTR